MNELKLLVTGANGFVGKHLEKKLTDSGFKFLKLSRELKKTQHNVIGLNHIGEKSIDVVIHLAAKAHVLLSDNDNSLDEFRKANVQFTMDVMQQAYIAGAKRFIFLSSIGVNGSSNTQPFQITDQPSPQENYAISKLEAEESIKDFAEKVGMEFVIIRPPLVYGQDAPGNFGKLLNLAKKNLPLPLGLINNKRSLVSLDNLVDLIITCIEHPKAKNQTFLVSDDDDISTTELIKQLIIASGKTPRLIPVPFVFLKIICGLFGKQAVLERACGNLQIDITHTKETLNWKPAISIKDGLKRCFKSFER